MIDDRTARVSFQPASSLSDRFVLDPTALDASFHALFALAEADGELPTDARLLPVQIASLQVFRPGADVVQGIVRVTSTTSRSRIADFILTNAAGAVVAQASQVRFRVAPRAAREALDEIAYRTTFVHLYEPRMRLRCRGWARPRQPACSRRRRAPSARPTRRAMCVWSSAPPPARRPTTPVDDLIGGASSIGSAGTGGRWSPGSVFVAADDAAPADSCRRRPGARNRPRLGARPFAGVEHRWRSHRGAADPLPGLGRRSDMPGASS
ncbi:MAG: hypothetical protein HC868_15865 [Sphingomonadales bacterium]|nr:hypothetical protein [Sphingomonadales bacterium]